MTTIEKTREKNFSAFFVDPIAKLDKLDKEEADTQKKKKQVVIDVAMRLEQEEGVAVDKICRIIIKHLKVKLKPRTIREYLPEKYKQLYKVKNAKKQRTLPLEPIPMDNLAAVPPLNQEGDDKETLVIDSKDALSLEDRPTQPLSQVDISMIDTDLVSSSEYPPSIDPETQSPEQLESDHNTRPNSCPACLKKDIKILELTEIIEKFENFTTADKLVDNMEVSYEFDIPLVELRKSIQEISSLRDDKVKVHIKIVIDSTTGETTMSFNEGPTS